MGRFEVFRTEVGPFPFFSPFKWSMRSFPFSGGDDYIRALEYCIDWTQKDNSKMASPTSKPVTQSCSLFDFEMILKQNFSISNVVVRLWTWLSWREKRKLPKEHPLDHCGQQWESSSTFPLLSNFTFPGLGFESQSRSFFLFPQLSATVNPMDNGFWITLSIDGYG